LTHIPVFTSYNISKKYFTSHRDNVCNVQTSFLLPYLGIAHDLREEVGRTALWGLSQGGEWTPEGRLNNNINMTKTSVNNSNNKR